MRVGIIIGRFQVPELTAGHRALIQSVQLANDKTVVLLGRGPMDGYIPENPLSFIQRYYLFAGYKDLAVFPLDDKRTNEEWSQQVDKFLKDTFGDNDCLLYAGRDSGFVKAYSGVRKVKEVEFYQPIPCSGTESRTSIKESISREFINGQIYALNKQFPHSYTAVDVALLKSPEPHTHGKMDVLIIKRADTGTWCFPGGFVDPTDQNFETAGQRELNEELGVISEDRLKYIGSYRIDDWRYRCSRDKIMSAFYYGWYSFGRITPNKDEVADFKWVPLDSVHNIVQGNHGRLASDLQAAIFGRV